MKLPISKLVNNTGQIEGLPANPRTINKDDYQKLLKSLQDDPDFLNHKPLHVYAHDGKYIVLGGNQRLKALKELGHKDVPVTIYDPETPVEVLKRRIIVDNSTFGDYDMDMLGNEWDDEPLDDWGVDLPDDWLQEEPEIKEDEAPEVDESEPPKSKLGEVYQLGRHRVMCADSTVKENIEKLMDGKKADLLLTDPPYGIGADTHAGKKENGWTQYGSSGWDKKRPDNRWYGISTTATKNQIIWGGNYFTDILPISQCWLVWDKGQRDFSLADGELAWTSFDKAMRIKTVARAAALQDGKVHPTQKSLEVMAWCIEEIAKDIETVLDPFLGSGSTLIACEQTDRTCYGMELDPKYTDVIRKRYHKFVTGSEDGWEDGTPAI